MNILELRTGARFEEFCKALLHEEFPRFQAFSAPDAAVDGYEADSETAFQFNFPEGSPRKDKFVNDTRKVLISCQLPKKLVFITPKDPTRTQKTWVEQEVRESTVEAEIWGQTKLGSLLRKHPAVRSEFFPTEISKVMRRLAKGEKPRSGDAEDGQEISAEEGEEIQQLIMKLAEATALRRRRKPISADYSREQIEFKNHFNVSKYTKLKKEEMGNARRYFEQKLYARRAGESIEQKRRRYIGGIKAIAKTLDLSGPRYQEELRLLTGLSSLTEMDMKQLKKVFEEFRRRQGFADAQTL